MSPYVHEAILAKHYGWTLGEIRNLDLQDFWVHVHICLTKESIDKEFQAKLAGGGGGPGKASAKDIMREGGTFTQQMRGAVKETTVTKEVSFKGKRMKPGTVLPGGRIPNN